MSEPAFIRPATVSAIIAATADTHWAAYDGGTAARQKIEKLIADEVAFQAKSQGEHGAGAGV